MWEMCVFRRFGTIAQKRGKRLNRKYLEIFNFVAWELRVWNKQGKLDKDLENSLMRSLIICTPLDIRGCIQKFPDWVIKKHTFTFGITRWEATQRVMASEFTRLIHKIAIELHLVAESCTICSSRSRRPIRKHVDTPSYYYSDQIKEYELGETCSMHGKRGKYIEQFSRES
jgi:hypothetical protein